jgi:hypothetical protein
LKDRLDPNKGCSTVGLQRIFRSLPAAPSVSVYAQKPLESMRTALAAVDLRFESDTVPESVPQRFVAFTCKAALVPLSFNRMGALKNSTTIRYQQRTIATGCLGQLRRAAPEDFRNPACVWKTGIRKSLKFPFQIVFHPPNDWP